MQIFDIADVKDIQFENLDLSEEGNNNAILFAISALMQGNGSVAELSEFVAKFAQDIEADGTLDGSHTLTIHKTNITDESASYYGECYDCRRYWYGSWYGVSYPDWLGFDGWENYDEYVEYLQTLDLITTENDTSTGDDSDSESSDQNSEVENTDEEEFYQISLPYRDILKKNAENLHITNTKRNLHERYLELGEEIEVPELELYAKRLLPFGVASTTPEDGYAEMAADGTISFAFNKKIKTESITPDTLKLLRGGTELGGTTELDENGQVLTLTPDELLDPATEYIVQVTHEIEGVDLSVFDSIGYSWHFTTKSWDIASGLLSYYPLDGDVSDVGGRAFDGTSVGKTLAEDRNGNSQGAYDLTPGSYIRIPAPKNMWEGDWTYSLWLYLEDTQCQSSFSASLLQYESPPGVSTYTTYLGLYEDDTQSEWHYDRPVRHFMERDFSYYWGYDRGYEYTDTDEFPHRDFECGQWMHVASTYSSTDNKMINYFDGVNNGQTYTDIHFVYSEDVLIIGYNDTLSPPLSSTISQSNPGGFSGRVDDIRFYDRALSQNDIERLHAE